MDLPEQNYLSTNLPLEDNLQGSNTSNDYAFNSKPEESQFWDNSSYNNSEKIKKSFNTCDKNNPIQTAEINDDYNLKESYSLDDKSYEESEEDDGSSSYSKKFKGKDQNTNQSSSKDNILMAFIQAIKEDNTSRMESIMKSLNSSQQHNWIHKHSPEGLVPIHYATLFSNINAFQFLANHISYWSTNEILAEGLPLLHWSLSLAIFDDFKSKSISMFKYIYDNYEGIRRFKDRLGRTPLHIIAQFDIEGAMDVITLQFEDWVKKDNNGENALKYCYLYNSGNVFRKILESRIKFNDLFTFIRKKEDKYIENCLVYHSFDIIKQLLLRYQDVYQGIKEDIMSILSFYSEDKGDDSNNSLESNVNINNNTGNWIQNCKNIVELINNIPVDEDKKAIETAVNNLQLSGVYNKTAFVYNNSCLDHIKLPSDPYKHMTRRNTLFENSDRLSSWISPPYGIMFSNIFIKNKNIILKETSRRTVLSDLLKCHDISYITKIKNKCESIIESQYQINTEYLSLDTDTYLSRKTFDTLFYSTGCVFEAVDWVMTKAVKNSFALIRPPGHHSGYFGAVDNSPWPRSNGFCVVNNVCIGAAYCKYQYRDTIKKIAIVDFDVHHGNGTEEIITWLDKKKNVSRIVTEQTMNICNLDINVELKKPWLDYNDPENVLFISLHHYNENNPQTFYPYTGSTETNTKKSSPNYPGGILNVPWNSSMKYSYEYRNAFRNKVIPRWHKFKPDIIFISAGFDAHENEFINAGKMWLQEYDYRYLTEELQKVANYFCDGRVVSVLEGGYNVKTGVISSFAQSVMTHGKSWNTNVNKDLIGNIMLTKIKRKREYEKDYENFKQIQRFDVKPRRSERIRQTDNRESNAPSNDGLNNNGSSRSNKSNIDDEGSENQYKQLANEIFNYEKEKKLQKEMNDISNDAIDSDNWFEKKI